MIPVDKIIDSIIVTENQRNHDKDGDKSVSSAMSSSEGFKKHDSVGSTSAGSLQKQTGTIRHAVISDFIKEYGDSIVRTRIYDVGPSIFWSAPAILLRRYRRRVYTL